MNNVVEYCGLIVGLDDVVKLGVIEVVVLMDFKLVVEQMFGWWKVKYLDLLKFYVQVQVLVFQFCRINYEWVLCVWNMYVDWLVNDVMDVVV